jgi:hypothetical protein
MRGVWSHVGAIFNPKIQGRIEALKRGSVGSSIYWFMPGLTLGDTYYQDTRTHEIRDFFFLALVFR